MDARVFVEAARAHEPGWTQGTGEGLLSSVRPRVNRERASDAEPGGTERTGEWFLPGMDPHVDLQAVRLGKMGLAHLACESGRWRDTSLVVNHGDAGGPSWGCRRNFCCDFGRSRK